jgi:hypothetical protein
MKYWWKHGLAALLVAGMLGAVAGRASAGGILKGGIGTAIKVFGIGFAVRQFGPEINSTINTLLQQKGLAYEGATKVVPIISVGKGINIGAAQVQGDPDAVDQVRAVGQAEIRVGDVGLQKLFPVNTSNPAKGYREIKGAGVSSIIDFRT